MVAHTNPLNLLLTPKFRTMRQKLLFPVLLIALFFSSCQKEFTQDYTESFDTQDASVVAESQQKIINLLKSNRLISKLDIESERLERTAQTGVKPFLTTRSSSELIAARLAQNLDFMHFWNLIRAAINPDDYKKCEPTVLDAYLEKITKDWTKEEGELFGAFGYLAFIEADYLDNEPRDEYFGLRGEYNGAIRKVMRDLQCFWDIPRDIILIDIHGSVYKDVETITKILINFVEYKDENGKVVPFPKDLAVEVATLLKQVFGSAHFQNYNHPLLTFNAFAEWEIPELGVVKKIAMGDGLLKGLKDIGFDDVAITQIMAHEYGHQVQFTNNIAGPETEFTPESTRRIELMADAYGAYYSNHREGAAFNSRKAVRIQELSFMFGDCAFNDPFHHGTQNQRKLSAKFGYETATRGARCHEILGGSRFADVFDRVLPRIIAPDAERSLINEELVQNVSR
jgi:hypothetical protein